MFFHVIVLFDLQNEVENVKQYVNYQKLACPSESQDDPRYKEIGNQCYYYENKTLSQREAQENCKNRFRDIGAGGKLFEPKTLAKDKAVALAGQEIIGNVWAYIGVHDLGNNGTFKYSTGEHFISIQNLPWLSTAYPRGTANTHCVTVLVQTNANAGKWIDDGCDRRKPSVCEATMKPQLSDTPFLVDLKVSLDYFLVDFLRNHLCIMSAPL